MWRCRSSWQTGGTKGACKLSGGPRGLWQTSLTLLEHGHVSVQPEETHLIPNSLCSQWDFYCVHMINLTAGDRCVGQGLMWALVSVHVE